MRRATLIGDVVASRSVDDRATLHADLMTSLDRVNDELRPLHPLRLTVGDEYQGAFARVGDAVRASLLLRLHLPDHDVRHGLGWGEIARLQADPPIEDGPGWWAARAAIEAVHAEQERAATRWRRTAFRTDDPESVALAQAVEAGLLLRDQAVDRLDARSLSVVRGMLAGQTQKQIAEELDVSPSAVSQRIRTDALAAIVAAQRAWVDTSGGGQS